MPLGRTAKYYKTHPEARKKKYAYDKEHNKKPEQRAKRVELIQKNREFDKKYGKAKRNGKDAAHQKDGSIRYIDKSKNRGNGTTTIGDRNARGKNK
jgi:hypothetical protein